MDINSQLKALWKAFPFWGKGALIGLAIALLPVLGHFGGLVIVGAIIGWAYGKAKSKKESTANTPHSDIQPPATIA
ncbi:MAG: hypothetical protein A2664_04525 [Candidatus Taylorbacteria bacterium RIFCSPHIGHO2_01_FULL_46_22b]|uniref:Uncharacterized protein n=1 Tax=Candidatus Taylorbacteria bacterium RIFCSPHIGHO2_01_FULL_46_22b TaxID=1802301 RepID=A0A1G2M4K7_9BACT|nr:MAG: hypothetical protein A2664_04525 [Candidatus Taylorbacteria bacterium RIFCSPHIGHO2_01_FULL_46_22b]